MKKLKTISKCAFEICELVKFASKINLQLTNRERHSPNVMVLPGQIKMNLGGGGAGKFLKKLWCCIDGSITR